MLPSTLYIMWPAKFEVVTFNGLGWMYLQENTLFDLWQDWHEMLPWVPSTSCDLCIYKKKYLWPWHQSNMKCCPVPSVSCDLHVCTCKVWRCYIQWLRGRYIIWPLTQVTWNVARYPLHHVTYASAKFKVATSNGLWEERQLQENTLFDLWVKVTKLLPSTL